MGEKEQLLRYITSNMSEKEIETMLKSHLALKTAQDIEIEQFSGAANEKKEFVIKGETPNEFEQKRK